MTVVELDGNNSWINDGERIYKVNISQVIPHRPMTDDNDDVIKLLDSLENFKTRRIPGVFLTEVRSPIDPRSWFPEFEIAKEMKINGLVSRNSLEVVLEETLPPDANVLGGYFVLAVKRLGTEDEIYKACFVVQRHNDIKKNILVHNSSNIRHQRIMVFIRLAAVFRFRI